MPTVIVTGANRGIGLEFARQYAADGWRVIATCRRPDEAATLKALAGVEVHTLDVGDPAAIQGFAAALAGERIDLLLNNAGIFGPDHPRQSKDGIDPEGWLQTLRINALAPVLLTLALRDNLAKAEAPKVATVSSQLGSIGENGSGGMYAYRASKAAINAGNRSLAVDLKERNIACVVLHPGWVQTDMGGANAPVKPADSVAGMRRVIARIGLDDSGCFYGYDGREIPW